MTNGSTIDVEQPPEYFYILEGAITKATELSSEVFPTETLTFYPLVKIIQVGELYQVKVESYNTDIEPPVRTNLLDVVDYYFKGKKIDKILEVS